MKLTRASSYALHAVAYMAQQKSDRPVASHKIAQERGIQVHEGKKSEAASGSAADVISVMLKTTSDERLVRGGVLRGTSLRLLGVDTIDIEVPLGGDLIYMRNRDVPGVIGKVGTLLGRHSVNIGNFALGRSGEQGSVEEAISVVQVDSPAPAEVLQEIAQLAEIHEVRGFKL